MSPEETDSQKLSTKLQAFEQELRVDCVAFHFKLTDVFANPVVRSILDSFNENERK